MPVQLTYPGVYIQEKASGVKTIEGVSTSVGLFIGYTTEGPINEPRLIGSVAEYIRIFGDDRSKSEMTDQVEQFYLNGGSEAWVMRIASQAREGQIVLQNESGDDVLKVTAKSPGLVGKDIRVSVDYDTVRPESTFNLTVERMELNSAGVLVVGKSETIENISMDPDSGRYANTVISAESELVNATVSGSPSSVAMRGYSVSAFGSQDLGAAILDITSDGSDPRRNLTITVGSHTAEAILPDSGTITPGAIEAAINTALTGTPEQVSCRFHTFADDAYDFEHLVILSGTSGQPTHKDVVINPGSSQDITGPLGLGALQRGLEVGPYAKYRPQPSHWSSSLGELDFDETAILDRFGAFIGANRSDRNKIRFADSYNTTPVLVPINDGATDHRVGTDVDNTTLGTATDATRSLALVRDALDVAASAVNGLTDLGWTGQRVGYRLHLRATFGGDDSSYTGATIVETNAADALLTTHSDSIFKNGSTATDVVGNVKREALDGIADGPFAADGDYEPSNGDAPMLSDYKLGFDIVKQHVPRFNIMVLPKSKEGAAEQRDLAYSAASKTCKDQFAFLVVEEPVSGWGTRDDVLNGIGLHSDGLVKDHSAIYWPQINIASDGAIRSIQPSGSVAGIMARTDATRGVWKAPAGLEASVTGARGQKTPVNDFDSGKLNPLAVNAVRNITQKTVVWGARTLDGFNNSGNVDYKYVPVRRFALFMEASLYEGLQTWVFEPNDEPTWAGVRRQVGSFMNGLFRQGAFAGTKPEDAYFVKIDKDTTTQNDINIGVMNVIVGFAPLKPAEFVVLTLTQKVGEIQV